jgi:hypothetical protein
MKHFLIPVVLLLTGFFATAQEAAHSDRALFTNHAHEHFQPAYAEGKLVTFEQGAQAPEDASTTDIRLLYEVEYPSNWSETLARPLCAYCDHFGDGENAWDYHDHVLGGLPSDEQNEAGTVYWHVLHLTPAYTGEESKDAAITKAYAALLPVQSGEAAQALIDAKLENGTPLTKVTDTKYVFTAPLSRW